MKIISIIAATMVLSACGKVDRIEASLTGYSKLCVAGVTYLQFTSGATAQIDAAGKPVTCAK